MSGRPRAVLLRGVNVSGTNRLPMPVFRDILEGLGLTGVETVIQSGNAVVTGGPDDATLGPLIRSAIHDRLGFAPEVFLRDLAGLEDALNHPFGPDARPNQVHAHFLRPGARLDESRLFPCGGTRSGSCAPAFCCFTRPRGLAPRNWRMRCRGRSMARSQRAT